MLNEFTYIRHEFNITEEARPEGRHHLADPGVDGRMILKWIFKTWDGEAWTGLSWLRIRTGCELL
jgi:hypothetical protein